MILGKLKILSKHHTSYDVLSDHLTDKGSLITSDLLSDNEHLKQSINTSLTGMIRYLMKI